MTRRRKLVAVALAVTTVAVAGAAWAAYQGRLRATHNVSKVQLLWAPATVTTSDTGTQLDPTSPGMTPTRDTANIGQTVVGAATANLVTLTTTNAYNSYRASITGDATISGGAAAKVQSVTLTGVPEGANVVAKLHPSVCGADVTGTANTITFDVQFIDIDAAPASFSIGVEVNVVGATAFVPGSCNAW